MTPQTTTKERRSRSLRAGLVALAVATLGLGVTQPEAAHAASGGYQTAFQANTGNLIAVGDAGNNSTGLGMKEGTSPSTAALPGGGYQMAFQANTGNLWTSGNGSNFNTGLGMMPGTSPSIAASGGSYRVAFQANTGNLWTYSPGTGGTNTGYGMKAGTSPSIVALPNGGYQMAFQANTGNLYAVGDGGSVNTGLGMIGGTSPSIAASGSTYRVAFQANTGNLWTYTPATGGTNTGYGMKAGTSPSIVALPSGGYQTAFQANTGNLYAVGDGGSVNTGLGMIAGTSPSIAASTSGSYKVAFQANTGSLWTYTPATGGTNLGQGMKAGTSPSIGALAVTGSFVFPQQTTKTAIKSQSPPWCYSSQTNCHHDYNAADIMAATGTPVVSPVAGKVVSFTNASSGVGSRVQILDDAGNLWYLAHMHDKPGILVTKGQRVNAGTLLGYVGTSAHAMGTNPHTHIDKLPPGYTSRPSCSAAECKQYPFQNIQPALVAAFQNLPA